MKTRSKLAAIAGIVTLGLVGAVAHADAPDPTAATVDNVTDNGDGTVTVTLKFSWSWVTHKTDPCSDRYGVGYAVDWDDASQAGNVVVAGVDVGVLTTNARNAADNLIHTAAHPCANTGTDYVTISHTYAEEDWTEETAPCIVTYDMHWGDKAKTTVKASDLIAGGAGHDKDNSVEANKNHIGGNVCASVEIPDGELTLVKVVNNGEGDTATIADFTLKAEGDDEFSMSGISGTEDVTEIGVAPGDYVLSEETTVEGYTASDWDCGDAPVAEGNIVSVLPGEDVTCTITNDGPNFGSEGNPPDTLPVGGSNSTNTGLAALVLALLGGGLVFASRRRHTA